MRKNKKQLKIIHIVGARPNFIKIAPLIKSLSKYQEITQLLIHTGQHYNREMSHFIFQDLRISLPDIFLKINRKTSIPLTAAIMKKLEPILINEKPDLMVVVGDVDSTLAGALTAVKLGLPIAHVESGLRSFDKTMPEEINRIIVDSVSNYLFVTEKSGVSNLTKEGIPKKKIFLVGNVMIDTLLQFKEKFAQSKIRKKLNLSKKNYAVLSLHRPGNVDCKKNLKKLIKTLSEINKKIPIIFPCHPRTRGKIKYFGLESNFVSFSQQKKTKPDKIILLNPLGYIDFIKLIKDSKLILTDSGGIQEEATILNIPCITLRNNTERPITLKKGNNILAGNNEIKIKNAINKILKGKIKKCSPPKLWDGKTAERINKIIISNLKKIKNKG